MTSVQDVINWATTDVEAAGLCEGFANNQFVGRFGSFRLGYTSANAAMAACKAEGTFHADVAPPSGRITWVFYEYPTYGHVMLSLGDGRALGDTSEATQKLNNTIGLMPWNAYKYRYLGYADTNGINTIPTIPTPDVNPFGNAGVQAGAGNVNLREKPSTTGIVQGELAAHGWFNAKGYTAEGGSVAGNTTWYFDGIDWISATVATPIAPNTLARLNPDGTPWVAPTPPPVYFTVTFDWSDGGTTSSEQVLEGDVITELAIPTRSGFIFGGWTTDAAGQVPFDEATKVTAAITLYAIWTPVPPVVENPTPEPPVSNPVDSPAAPVSPGSSLPESPGPGSSLPPETGTSPGAPTTLTTPSKPVTNWLTIALGSLAALIAAAGVLLGSIKW
jgi:uncharacterized repeat protein (TIGR02543 family)